MTACAEGKTDVVSYLIHVGTNVDLRSSDGMTCLHLAAKNGHLEAVHAVLTNGKLATRKNLLNKTVNSKDSLKYFGIISITKFKPKIDQSKWLIVP